MGKFLKQDFWSLSKQFFKNYNIHIVWKSAYLWNNWGISIPNTFFQQTYTSQPINLQMHID